MKQEQHSRKHGIPNSNTSVLRFSVVLVAILFSSHLNDPIVVNYIIILAHNTYVEALYSLLMYPQNSIIDKVHGYSNLCWIDLLFVAGTTRQRRRKSPITSYATVNSGCSALCQLSKQEQWWWWFRVVVNHRPPRFAKGWFNKASSQPLLIKIPSPIIIPSIEPWPGRH